MISQRAYVLLTFLILFDLWQGLHLAYSREGSATVDRSPEPSFYEHNPNKPFPSKVDIIKNQWAGWIRVKIQSAETFDKILLTFTLATTKETPIFFMSNSICGGAGLKIEKLFTQASKEYSYLATPYWEGGGLVIIDSIAHPNDTSGPPFFRVANDQDDRFVVIRQWVSLRHISSNGLYTIRYEHPWENMTETNIRFTSNTLLLLKLSAQQNDELYNSLFKGNPQLELASYQFRNPPISMWPKYRQSRNLKVLKTKIRPGTSYEKVFYLLGPPDKFLKGDNEMRWVYETSPVYVIDFQGKHVAETTD